MPENPEQPFFYREFNLFFKVEDLVLSRVFGRVNLFFLISGFAVSTHACDLCAVYSATQAHGEIGKGFFGGVAEQFTHFGTIQQDGREVRNETGQYLDSSISQFYAGYNFNDRVGLQFNLPVIYRSFKRPEGFATDRDTESGLGDVALLGHLRAYQHETKQFTFAWSIIGGVKFPTGSSDRIKEELNEIEIFGAPESGIHGHDLALGTGSYDGIVGTGIFLRYQRVFLTANTQYAIRSTGNFDYRYADDLTWSGGPGVYLLLEDNATVSLQLVVSGERKKLDTFQGSVAADTGITSVYLGPQINFTWSEKFSAEIGADLPVSIDNTALQTVPDYRIRAGITYRF
ncbi:MAG: hypothetical protein ABI042_04185 [Verrucomicrobiota bacterium]